MFTAPANTIVLLFFLLSVTFYSCERIDNQLTPRVPKGDVYLGGCLKVAVSELPNTLIPGMITDPVSSEVGLHLHNGLLKQDAKTLKVVPGLAESWSVDDAGTSYVFNLRKRALFHEDECFGNASREITARDFLYSFKQLCSKEASAAYETTFKDRVVGASDFHEGRADDIAGIKVIDDYTLSIQLLKPDPSFLYVLAQPSMAVVAEKAVKKYGAQSVVGAGPFMLGSAGKELVLVRNEDYYAQDAFGNGVPFVDTLIFKAIPTREQQLNAFFAGEIDLVSSIYPDPVKQILEQHIAEFSGRSPQYIMLRETEAVGYESYSIHRAGIIGFGNNFMGYRDFSLVQIKQ